MAVVIAVNITLAAIVFAGLITMVMRTIRGGETRRATARTVAVQPVRSRPRRARPLVRVRPWA